MNQTEYIQNGRYYTILRKGSFFGVGYCNQLLILKRVNAKEREKLSSPAKLPSIGKALLNFLNAHYSK